MQSGKPKSPYLTPPQIAARLGVVNNKVLGWIRSGELRAVNLAASRSGQPRWKVLESELQRFLDSRAAMPPPPKPPRTRKTHSDGGFDFVKALGF